MSLTAALCCSHTRCSQCFPRRSSPLRLSCPFLQNTVTTLQSYVLLSVLQPHQTRCSHCRRLFQNTQHLLCKIYYVQISLAACCLAAIPDGPQPVQVGHLSSCVHPVVLSTRMQLLQTSFTTALFATAAHHTGFNAVSPSSDGGGCLFRPRHSTPHIHTCESRH